MLIGVLGAAGSMGSRHIRNLAQMGHQVRAFDVGQLPADLYQFGMHDGDPYAKDIQALVIATPSFMHPEHLEKAIEAGKHVFIEKPIALGDSGNTNKIRRLLLQATEKTLTVAVGFNLRFHPRVMAVKAEIDDVDPTWGTFIVSQHSEKDEYLRDGVTDNWMSHEIDLAIHLLGPVARVVGRSGGENCKDLLLLHENGRCSHIHGDYIARQELRHSHIVGHRRNLTIDFNEIPISERDYREEILRFTHAVTGGTTMPLATGANALAVLEVCEWAKADQLANFPK